MTRVIYADVLVVLNIYVTYALLSLTGILCRRKRNVLRIFCAAAAAGFYSLLILLPDGAEAVTSATGIPFGVFLCFAAFGFINKKAFLRLCLSFFAFSFGFAGIMLFIWMFFAPDGMYFSNGIIYFNISTSMLVIMTIVCYAVILLCGKYIKSRTPSDTVYDCEIVVRGRSYSCHCFLDTGNSLCDPFTGKPVVIVNKDALPDTVPDNIFESDYGSKGMYRLIPCSGITGKNLLAGFTADKIRIIGIKKDISYTGVTVAVTKEKIFGGRYDGILPCEIFSGRESEYDNKNQKAAFEI